MIAGGIRKAVCYSGCFWGSEFVLGMLVGEYGPEGLPFSKVLKLNKGPHGATQLAQRPSIRNLARGGKAV